MPTTSSTLPLDPSELDGSGLDLLLAFATNFDPPLALIRNDLGLAIAHAYLQLVLEVGHDLADVRVVGCSVALRTAPFDDQLLRFCAQALDRSDAETVGFAFEQDPTPIALQRS